jgi:hypothetical protein
MWKLVVENKVLEDRSALIRCDSMGIIAVKAPAIEQVGRPSVQLRNPLQDGYRV